MIHISVSLPEEVCLSVSHILLQFENEGFQVGFVFGSCNLLVFEEDIQVGILLVEGVNFLEEPCLFIG